MQHPVRGDEGEGGIWAIIACGCGMTDASCLLRLKHATQPPTPAAHPGPQASSPQGDGGAEPVEQSGEPERRTYPFRDRTLVTINRTAEDQQVPRPG